MGHEKQAFEFKEIILYSLEYTCIILFIDKKKMNAKHPSIFIN